MKKLFCLLFIVVLCFFANGCNSNIEKDYEYIVEGEEVSIVSYKGAEKYNIVIPTFIEGKKVTKIREGAFDFQPFYIGDKYIESYDVNIVLPQYLRVIESWAFVQSSYYSENNPVCIDYVFLPKTVEYVGKDAFSVETLLLFEGNGNSSYYNKTYYNVKKEEVLFQDNMIFMTWYNDGTESEAILLDCLRSNKNAHVPPVVEINGQIMPVTRIGDRVFNNCPNLESMELHDLLEDVNDKAFNYFYNLETFKSFYPNLKLNYYKGGYYIPSNLNPYFMFFVGEEQFTLNDDTQYFNFNISISNYEFSIEDGIKYIPSANNKCFLGYDFVDGHIFQKGEIIFNKDTKIINLHDGNLVSSIKDHTYYIPSRVTYIYVSDGNVGGNKFVVDSDDGKYISSNYSLYGNYGTTLLIASRYSVSSVGDIGNAFIVPNGVEYVKAKSICSWDFETIYISDSVVEIDRRAFINNYFPNILIGKSLKYLGNLCIGNSDLSIIEVSEENPYYKSKNNFIISRDEKVLFGVACNNDIDMLEIPESVTQIFEGALDSLERKIALANENVVAIGEQNAFHLTILCKNRNVNSKMEVIIGDFITIDDALYSYTETNATFVRCFSKDKNFKMKDYILDDIPVTHIAKRGFYYSKSTNITLSSNLKVIGAEAFTVCDLESLIIPDGVTEIKEGTFYVCARLKWVIVPETVVTFEWFCFRACPKATIYLKMNSIPSSWNKDWNEGAALEKKRPYHFQNEWQLVDGEPVLK